MRFEGKGSLWMGVAYGVGTERWEEGFADDPWVLLSQVRDITFVNCCLGRR